MPKPPSNKGPVLPLGHISGWLFSSGLSGRQQSEVKVSPGNPDILYSSIVYLSPEHSSTMKSQKAKNIITYLHYFQQE